MAAARKCLPRSRRLQSSREYDAVFKGGHRSEDRLFAVVGVRRGAGPRLGLIVSRRVDRRAVARNRIKRHIREAFRQHLAPLSGLEVVVIARAASAKASAATLRGSLHRHFIALKHRCNESC